MLVVGKRDKAAKKYSDVKEHSVSVLNSLGSFPPNLRLRWQDKLGQNAQIGNNGRGKHTWLTGLLKCASCGYALKVAYKDSGNLYLQCGGKYNLAKCDTVTRAELDTL